MVEFREVVRRRRMVRNYAPDPVDPEVVRGIVDSARRSPSAGFSQGQYFVVVTEAPTRHAIAELADEPAYVAAGLDPWISSAPVHVVVCTSEADYHRRYQEPDKLRRDGTEIEWVVPYWWVDAGASLMTMLLAAVDAGLAAGFFGVHRLDGLAELLGLPPDVVPIGVVTLGHPAPDRRSGSLARGWKPSERVIHHERWGTGP
jgi:nitroreductase